VSGSAGTEGEAEMTSEVTTHRIEVPTVVSNFSAFALIFSAKKFLEAARAVIAEESHADGRWHPVGKFLACQSIDVSFKAFLRLNGEQLDTLRKRYNHRIAQLLDETERMNIQNLVSLTDEERAEIRKAEDYYARKVFQYPFIYEAGRAYPGDPDVAPLLSAAEKLVEGLYYPCRAA
jgi:hypothetical protein